MGNPDFKDVLRELIEKNGGLEPSNLARLSDKIREFKPEFSATYLRRLLSGHPPTKEDREAISQALEPAHEKWMSDHWRIEEVEERKLAFIAYRFTKNQKLIVELVDDFKNRVSHRNITPSESEAIKILSELYKEKELKDEMELFRLSV